MKTFLSKVLVAVALTFSTAKAVADSCNDVVINAMDAGWYDASGYHDPANDNYYCGDGGGSPVFPLRNFFTFAIPSSFTQQVVSASLRVYTFLVGSPTGSETYQLRHVSTPVSTLQAGGTGLTSIYADLGDGAIYGSLAISNSYQFVTIPLNNAFISNLTAAAGATLAIGGELSSLDGIPNNEEYVFFSSSGTLGNIQLILAFAGSSPLAITMQPQSASVPAGTSLYFDVQACGSSALNYQWQFYGTNIPGANNASYLVYNTSSNQAGPYRVIVTNLSGSVTSAVATLTVTYQPPSVFAYATTPVSPAYAGDSIGLCAVANGSPSPLLQWRFNGTNLPGEVNSCLYLNNVQTNQSGNYTIVASNAVGSATSAVISVVVTARPPVYAQFQGNQPPFAVGDFAYACATVNIPNDGPLSLQWRFNGTNLPNQTNFCLYIGYVDTNDAGFYSVVAANFSGAYTSAPIELTAYVQPPGFPYLYFSLGGTSALVGNDVILCSATPGSPPLSYQWRFNGADLPGQTASCLTLLAISNSLAGNYSVVVSNVAGAVTSSVVNITVNSQAPIFTYQPGNVTVIEGTTVRIGGYAPAGPPAEHVLQFNGTNVAVPFSFQNTLGGFTLLDVTLADAGAYRVIASNAFGVATSAVATLTVIPAGPLDRWTQRNPLPQSQRLFSVAYGNGQYVAVGDRGTVLTSAEGTNWFLQSRRVDLTLEGVAYGAGAFVAVGDAGTILASADGTNWSYAYSAPFINLNGVTFGNGRFVAVGEGEAFVLVSSNGVTWDRSLAASTVAGRSVAYGNGIFVAVGSSGIMRSTNGLDWTFMLSVSSQLEAVSYVQNQFIAVGDNGLMLASSDGVSWTTRNSGTTRRLLGVAYGNGKFVSAGVRGIVFTSLDAVTWTAATSGTPDRLETLTFGNGLFIAAGENGTIIVSTNGTAWAKQNRGPTRDLDGMALASGTIVIVGKGGTIITSTDGTHYTERNAGLTNDLHGIGWGNGLWVAVGEPGIILTSSNTVQWTSRLSGNSNSLKAANYANGKWIVVGTQGAVITSTDGVNWSPSVTSPSFDLNDVAYGKGVYVIASDGAGNQNGSAFVSSNAVTWTWLNSGYFGVNLRSMLFTNGVFLATANDGLLFVSQDGFLWNVSNVGAYLNLRGATFARGLWCVVGNYGYIFTSSNLLSGSWTVRPTRTFENLHEVVYLDGKFVTMGNRGTVLQSGRFVTELEPPRFNPGIGSTVGIKGILSQPYQVQASSDLVQWTNIFRFTNSMEETFVTDTNAVLFPRRFYRVVPD